MKDKIVNALKEIQFVEKYKELCNSFSDADNGKSFKKQELIEVFKDNQIELKFSSKEKLFYQNYTVENFDLRFIVDFKYGFIECMYAAWNDSENFRGGFGTLCTLIQSSFEDEVLYKFPIAIDQNSLKEILDQIIKIHLDFLKSIESSGEL